MSKQKLIENLVAHAPENKLDTIISFINFILREEDSEINNMFLSETSLAKDWLSREEDAAWENL